MKAAKPPRDHSPIFISLTRIGVTPDDVDDTISRAIQARLNAPRSVLDATQFSRDYVAFVEAKRRETRPSPRAVEDAFISASNFSRFVSRRGSTARQAARHTLSFFAEGTGLLVSYVAFVEAQRREARASALAAEDAFISASKILRFVSPWGSTVPQGARHALSVFA